MSSHTVSLGNGAWVAQNITLTDAYVNYEDNYYGYAWTPSKPSSNDIYSYPSIDFNGINETASSLFSYADGGTDGEGIGYSLTWRAYLVIEESGSYVSS